MLKRLALLLLLSTFTFMPSPVMAAENGTGIVEGQLVNHTANGGSVAGQDITLNVYQFDTELEQITSVTDANGRFNFSGLLTNTEYSYKASLYYQEAEYFSPI